MASAFVAEVGTLLHRPGTRRREQRAGSLLGLAVSGARVPDDADVELDLTLESADDSTIVALGEVRAPWVGECSRCLRPIVGQARNDVRELFETKERAASEASRATEDDSDIYPLRGDQADLEPLARDAILLALPQAPLCASDCAGLCPVCGADRNVAECGCDTELRDERWRALDALKDSAAQDESKNES